MSINGLQSAVLEAGGHIEDRMLVDEFPNFTPVYTFTREALEKFADQIRFDAADEAWKVLINNGIGWELRKAVTDAIHAQDATA